MEYNKKNQPYTVINRFRVTEEDGREVEYCRVKFSITNHEQIVSNKELQAGDFADKSLDADFTTIKSDMINKETLKQPHEETMIKNSQTEVDVSIETDHPLTSDADSFEIIATNPKGADIKVNSADLELFCNENKLDLEVVQAVLEGRQKTHRKWRFAKAQ